MVKINKLEAYLNDIENSIKSDAYLSGLALALTLPDICGKIEKDGANNREKYINWFDKWVYSKTYKLSENKGFTEDNFLKIDGNICYALRCCFLHAGNFDLKSKGENIDRFQFCIGKENKNNGNLYSYMFDRSGNVINIRIQLNVVEFLQNMIYGVKIFIKEKDLTENEQLNIDTIALDKYF